MRRYFALFLILPAVATYRLSGQIDPRFLGGYAFAVSCITYLAYWLDKRRARNGGSRTPEATLHLLEALGGWIAAFLAQQQFRHKSGKRSYLRTYWTIVGVYQYLAFEYAFGWPIFRSLRSLIASAFVG